MSKQKKTIHIAAGHSNTDPGAIGGGWKEADVALDMRAMVAYYLTRAQFSFTADGTGRDNLPLSASAAQARFAQVAVEFHCNSGPATATGAEVLAAPHNMRLAADLSAAISGALNIRNRGAKPENSGQHARLAYVRAGGVIAELFFISNAADRAAWDARKWLAAKAAAEVIMRHASGEAQ